MCKQSGGGSGGGGEWSCAALPKAAEKTAEKQRGVGGEARPLGSVSMPQAAVV